MFSQRLIFKVLLISSLIVSSGCNIFGSGSGSKGSNDLEAKQKDADPTSSEDEQPSDTTTCSSTSVDHSQTVLPEGTRGVSTEIVTCDEGYTKTGDAFEWSCNADGEWVGEACVSLYDCEAEVSNHLYGEVKIQLSNGESAGVLCELGYKANTSSVTCGESENGFSFDQTPVCERVVCPEQSIENSGIVSPANYDTFTTVNCNPGFVNNVTKEESLKLFCNNDGEWVGDSCVSYCDLSIENSSQVNYKIVNEESVFVQCEPGYSGSEMVTCSNGVASVTPTCTPYVKSTISSPTFTESYAEENFHCDLNDDGVIDSGELVNFPDHSFVFTIDVETGKHYKLPVGIKNYPEDRDSSIYVSWDDNFGDAEDTNFYLDWGNGKCVHVTSNEDDSILGESFSAQEQLRVRIIGNVGNFNGLYGIYSGYLKSAIREVINLGDVGWYDLSHSFDSPHHTVSSLKNEDLENLENIKMKHSNTNNVGSFSYMFSGLNLESLDLSNLDTSNANSMRVMFSDMQNLKSLDLSKFNTANVTSLSDFLSDTSNLESLYIGNFITNNVVNMESMFENTGKLKSIDLSSFSTPNLESMRWMFKGSGIVNLNLSTFDTTNVSRLDYVFSNMSNLREINLSSFNTINTVNLCGLFYNSSNLIKLDLTNFDVSNATCVSEMFKGITKQFEIKLFDTSNLTEFDGLFWGANLSNFDLENLNTDSATSLNALYRETIIPKGLHLHLENLNMTNVTSLATFFYGATFPEGSTLDLSVLDTSLVENFNSWITDIAGVSKINLNGLDFSMSDEQMNSYEILRTVSDREITLDLTGTTFDPEKSYLGVFDSMDMFGWFGPPVMPENYIFKCSGASIVIPGYPHELPCTP